MELENKPRVYVISVVCVLILGLVVFVWFWMDRQGLIPKSGVHVFGSKYPHRFYKAVVFDQGGVLIPFERKDDLEKFTTHLSNNPADQDAYLDCELGITTIEDITRILEIFSPGISKVKDFESQNISDFMRPVNQDMIRAAQLIKKAGLKIAILTNNYYWSHERNRSFIIEEASEFDLVVESCREGVRKPDPRIFEITAQRLGVDVEECIMVDDMKSNIRGAKAVGMTTVEVVNDNTTATIDELERMLDLKLQ